MTGECSDDPDEVAGTGEIRPAAPPPETMSLSFYAALGLIGLLVVMVVVLNYPAEKAMAGTTITRANWTLQSLEDTTGILVPAMSGTEVTALFGSDGRLGGNAGCNRYFATFTTKDFQLSVSGIGSTKMYCTGEGIMMQETAFLADLGRASSFRVGDSFLKIYDASGKTVLVFVSA